MIKEWLERYNPKNKEEAQSALCKIMLEIALAGLYRSVFFDKAAFYGGTALIIFHKLDRFSQDLHFSLLQVEKDFSLKKYQDASVNEFAALRINVSISEKQKVKQNNINSAFPKSETLWRELKLETILPQIGVDSKANIKIKIEVDTAPFEF
ncbi:putative nucleotidyltransferase component of viral defense system [Flavobacterium sp. CG_9.1]|uniref:nucleotidyl transferase AbiEii/AbiGii toxin family protein n=1 Tax=Flavobacterium sp. CG_9.1 TaxID=2787728 RepID=UPI0018C8F81B|nr:nucleotidyl transferase AbiEii/AbiGii toxin family protein [Flavobacterium sp. CG_9.1]MBG6063631.1 putative nucleotidyltransferase component of viral defense system [Flavobacterium sp. CG_9.1]